MLLPEGNGEKPLLRLFSACCLKTPLSVEVCALTSSYGGGICSQLRLSLPKENGDFPRDSFKKTWLNETDMERDQRGVHHEDQDPWSEVCLLPGQVQTAAGHLDRGLLRVH